MPTSLLPLPSEKYLGLALDALATHGEATAQRYFQMATFKKLEEVEASAKRIVTPTVDESSVNSSQANPKIDESPWPRPRSQRALLILRADEKEEGTSLSGFGHLLARMSDDELVSLATRLKKRTDLVQAMYERRGL